MTSDEFRIGNRLVGTGHPPLLIAEMSGNHNGSLDAALRIVELAAANGAAAIKLQTFTADTLTIDSQRPEFFIDDPGGLWHQRRLWELYQEAHTPWDWHEPLFEAARRAGLLCISSAFDISSVEFLLRLGVDAIKIASFELIHIPLIQAAAQSGKPLLVSTGMGSLDEVDDAVAAMRAHPNCRFVLLKCTSSYPSVERDADVLTLPDMKRRYQCEVGLSDHTLRPYVAYAATALGAVVIEKHLTTSRAAGGVDSAFSLEPSELQELATGIDLTWQSLGTVRYASRDSERASRAERPSVYVVDRVGKGQTFNERNLRVIRPSGGLAPKALPMILGRAARHDIEAGTPMSWDFVSEERS